MKKLRYSQEDLASAKAQGATNLIDPNDFPPRPVGVVMQQLFTEQWKLSMKEVADKAQIGPTTLQSIVAGRLPLDRATAQQLEATFEGAGVFLLRHQFAYQVADRTGVIPPQSQILAIHL